MRRIDSRRTSAGIIEKSCLDGQRTYHVDLEKAMREYIHEHLAEFVPEGVDAAAVEESAAAQAIADAGGAAFELERRWAEQRLARAATRRPCTTSQHACTTPSSVLPSGGPGGSSARASSAAEGGAFAVVDVERRRERRPLRRLSCAVGTGR